MPAKCVSSVSPRFHYRRLAFCFLPVAAILESQQYTFEYQWVTEEKKVTEEILKFLKSNENNLPEYLGHGKGSVKRNVYIYEHLY
jgi:hypothetical protein